jgi:hypothetical protein
MGIFNRQGRASVKEEFSENLGGAPDNFNADPMAEISAPDAEYFVFPASFAISSQLKQITQLTDTLPEELTLLVATFESSLNRMNKAVSLPYRMAWLGILDIHKQAMLHQATILALDQLDPFKDDLDKAVPPLRDQIANKTFLEFIGSDVGRNVAHRETIKALQSSATLDRGGVLRGAKDLLLQTVISVWAALETFVSDFVRIYLNQRPEALSLLLADEDAKKRIGRIKWTIGELMTIGLDLSGRVGDLVLSENDLSDLVSMKAVLCPLLDKNPALIAALNDPELFILGKLRNLLAHRGGLVDARFEKETNQRWNVGETVTIRASELDKFITATINVISQILLAVAPLFAPPNREISQ